MTLTGLAACLNTHDVPSSLQRCAHEDGKYFKIYFSGGGNIYIFFMCCGIHWKISGKMHLKAFFLVKD